WAKPLYQHFKKGLPMQGHDDITPLISACSPPKLPVATYRETLGSLHPRKKLKAGTLKSKSYEWGSIGDLALALGRLFLHKDLPLLLDPTPDVLVESLEK